MATGLPFSKQHHSAFSNPDDAAIRRQHPIFKGVRFSASRHLLSGENRFGGIRRIKFLGPKIRLVQPYLRGITKYAFALTADESVLEGFRGSLPDYAVNRMDQRLHFSL